MAVRTRRELLDRIEELETENEALQSRMGESNDIIRDEESEFTNSCTDFHFRLIPGTVSFGTGLPCSTPSATA